ncbi:MAG: hypothetical protein DHS80DRAFT_31498 [Piptocephalis tieghemiana]|nr:MAG: hypothetical protein DHS80DRAFT_31498 [Piptocephalis tieghemiana]
MPLVRKGGIIPSSSDEDMASPGTTAMSEDVEEESVSSPQSSPLSEPHSDGEFDEADLVTLDEELEREEEGMSSAINTPDPSVTSQTNSTVSTPQDFSVTEDGDLEEEEDNLTRRQRARMYDQPDESLLELPEMESKKRKYTAEEAALRRSEVSRRREVQRKQKMEQIHRQTINKLLKKQASRKTKKEEAEESAEPPPPPPPPSLLRYRWTKEGTTLSIPQGMSVYQGQSTSYPEARAKCCVPGCGKTRQYRIPKTNQPVCSLEHYQHVMAKGSSTLTL